MFCAKCGQKLEEDSRFCIKCGTVVNTATVPNTPPPIRAFGGVTPVQMQKKIPIKSFIIAGSIFIIIAITTIILLIPVFHYKADTRETVDVDVYAFGFVGNKEVSWRNGKRVNLPDKYTNSIYVIGNDEYVCGNLDDKAVYWKNEKPVALTKTSDSDSEYEKIRRNSNAYSIYVSGNDVYVCGEEYNKAVYWKNGKLVELSSNDKATAYSIYVSGNDVYVCGEKNNKAVYWKNGKLIELPSGNSDYLFIDSIYASGNDVYVGGSVVKTGILDFLGKSYVVLWKNNKIVRVYSIRGFHDYNTADNRAIGRDSVFVTKK